MAEPTTKQRKMFAAMGIAMPDGSYYIRNANDLQNAIESVGRATPNAGESDVARRNAVRRHIMKRANALKLSSKIPDTWGSDGSLTVASHVDVGMEFISHFGRKGMHWGEHIFTNGASSGPSAKKVQKRQDLLNEATKHEEASVAHGQAAIHIRKLTTDLQNRGLGSEIGKAQFGDHAANLSQRDFYRQHHTTKQQGLYALEDTLRYTHNQHVKAANRHAAKAEKLRAKADKMQHADVGEVVDIYDLDVFDIFALEHFGVKGMHWGVRRDSSSASGNVHPDVVRARVASEIIRTHGLHAVGNSDLKALNQRSQLENDYARLNVHTSEGKKFLAQFARQQSTAVAAGYTQKYAPQGINWLVGKGIKVALGSGKHQK